MNRSALLVKAAAALLLSATVSGQQPPNYLVLGLKSNSATATRSGILFLDPATGTATPVSSPIAGRTLIHVTALSPGPSFMGTLAVGSASGSTVPPWIWQLPLAGNRYSTLATFIPNSMPSGTVPHRVAHTRLAQGVVFTIQGGSANDVYFADAKTKQLVRANAGIAAGTALAGDVVVLGDKAYAAFYKTTGTRRGIIVEWRLDGKSKPVQIHKGANPVVVLTADYGGLMAADDKGNLTMLTNTALAGWVAFPLAATGISGIQGIAAGYHPQLYTFYFAVANKQGGTDIVGWASRSTPRRVFTDPRPFGDLKTFITTEGGVLFYGTGCAGSAGTPRMTLSGYPTQGNTGFAMAMQAGPANAASLLALGSRRTSTSLAAIGAPGCFLRNDALVVLAGRTTLGGTARVSFAVPTNASLRGLHVFGQWGVADRNANAAGLITTEGAEYVIY